jgi:hypothetical protein
VNPMLAFWNWLLSRLRPRLSSSRKKTWTFMVYMGGDNGTVLSSLEGAGEGDLAEMKQVGSNDRLNVVAQYDRMSDHRTRRYRLTRGSPLAKDVVADLGETNTGDPQVLRSFITWAVTAYPADHYALVLWNHGSGWKEDNIYQLGKALRLPPETVNAREARRFAQRRTSRAFFSTTMRQLLERASPTRAILFDDSSRDFLDNAELASILAFAAGVTGGKLDLLGMDACLMSMIEVAYQCRRSVNVFVASEETEPGAGWPYERVLGRLAAQPDAAPQAFGASIVSEYIASYDASAASEVVTQSALDLARVEDAAAALDLLSAALLTGLADPRVYAGIRRARKDAQTFYDRDYLDLVSLCTLFQKYCSSQPISDAAQSLIDLVSPGAEGSLVLHALSLGSEVQDSHGLSIYFPPEGRISPFYETLELSKTNRWHDFLEGFRNKA